MRTLENSTAVSGVPCITFREKIATDDYHYIIIENGTGCSSYVSGLFQNSRRSKIFYLFFEVGRMTGSSTLRTVTLEIPSCIYKGIIMHELIHVLGRIF